jgi:hypothetical protein
VVRPVWWCHAGASPSEAMAALASSIAAVAAIVVLIFSP